MATTIILPGTKITAEEKTDQLFGLELEVKASTRVDPRARATGQEKDHPLTGADDTDVIELKYENGITRWVTIEQLRQEGEAPTAREVRLPATISTGDPSRGLVGDLALKALKVFGIKLPDKIADKGAREIAEYFESQLKPGPGLYRLTDPNQIGAKIEKPGELRSTKPYLLFLHGTASSTSGSFGKMAGTPEWEKLAQAYPERILGLEHLTFSQSPVANLTTVVDLLPQDAMLHLVSHSRGGLVGDLLCLSGAAKSRDRFEDLARKYKESKREKDLVALRDLWDKLLEKRIRIERFVRVACPARGTTLASKRIDLIMTALLNAFGLIPGLAENPIYDFAKATLLALVKKRSDPKDLPGIEAMMPDSPLVYFLNHPDLRTTSDLAVIAGDIEMGSISSTLLTMAANTFFWAKNDLVVNTTAMYGGIRREKPAYYFFDQGKDVSHFRYFINPESRTRLAAWLTQEESEPAKGFSELPGGMPSRIELRSVRGGEDRPVVILLPGIMGSHLRDPQGRIWLSYGELMRGGMSRLEFGDAQVEAEPEGIMARDYQRLVRELESRYRVIPFAYDWRRSIKEAGKKLAERVDDELNRTKLPIHLVGHSMGGLVARSMVAQAEKSWGEVRRRNGRLLMLGTPNHGSYAIPRMLLGKERLLNILALLDIEHSMADLLGIIRQWPGVMDLLPAPYLEAAKLKDLLKAEPEAKLLEEALRWREKLNELAIDPECMAYVAGRANQTPSGIREEKGKVVFEATTLGDGRVTYELGKLAGVPTWYANAAHGDLANHPPSFSAYLELLEKGETRQLPDAPRVDRGIPVTSVMREEEEALFPLEDDLAAAAAGSEDEPIQSSDAFTVRISVKHGDLRFAKYPVAVGHYKDDNLVSAEWYIDKRLQGRLSSRLAMGLYPDEVGTTEAIYMGKDSLPPGALIIGLGNFGEINPESVRQGVTAAALRHAMAIAELGPAAGETSWRSAAFSTLLIGTYGGNALSIEESIKAILLGVVQANRRLKELRLGDGEGRMWDRVRIDRIELVELYEDIAINAIRAAHRLVETRPVELSVEEGIEVFPRELVPVDGGRYQRPTDIYAQGWWRRIQVTVPGNRSAEESNQPAAFPGLIETLSRSEEMQQAQRKLIENWVNEAVASTEQRALLSAHLFDLLQRGQKEKKKPGGMEFLVLTDRARAEASLQANQRLLVDRLIAEAVHDANYSPEISATLFELLLPNELKALGENVVFLLDSDSAQYPWELLADRSQNQKPLSVRVGMLRQFKTAGYRINPQPAVGRNALVLGDTTSGYDPLPGAQEEAKAVAAELKQGGYEIFDLIQADGVSVVHELFAREYQILHLAAHGTYHPDDLDRSGVVLGDNLFLTSKELNNLRNVPELVFLNCCFLGRIDEAKPRLSNPYPHQLAASISEQLIKMGTKAVVAAGWAVNDAAASTFATEFYRQMFRGRTFGDATLEARKLTYARHGSTNTWGAYQCYGNPGFKLGHRPDGRQGDTTPAYYSRREYLQIIREIAEQRDVEDPERNKKLQAQLSSIVKNLPDGLQDGEILAEIGRAWGTLNEKRKAISAYREALRKSDAKAPLKAIEQLANLECRLAEENYKKGKKPRVKTGAKTGPKASEDPMALLNLAQQRLELLLQMEKDNSERLGLFARIYKAKVLLAATAEEQVEMLQKAAEHYRLAYDKSGKKDPWTRTNWLLCEVLSGEGRPRKIGDALTDLRKDVRQRLAELSEPSFWDRVYVPDADLLGHLWLGNLEKEKDGLIAAYHGVLGSRPTLLQVDSVRGQMDFIAHVLKQKSKKSPEDEANIAALEEIMKSIQTGK